MYGRVASSASPSSAPRMGVPSCGSTAHRGPGGRSRRRPGSSPTAEGIRIIGIDRPGVGLSTPHLYDAIADHARGHRDRRRPARAGPLQRRRSVRRRPVRTGRPHGPSPTVCPPSASSAALPQPTGPTAMRGGLVGVATQVLHGAAARPRAAGPPADHLHPAVQAPREADAPGCTPVTSPEGDRAVLERPEFQAHVPGRPQHERRPQHAGRRSTTRSCSRATGASPRATCSSRCGGGTATRTTSSRSPTAQHLVPA